MNRGYGLAETRPAGIAGGCLLAFFLAYGSQKSLATVISITGRAATTVQELIDDSPGSVNSDHEEFGVDTDEFPIDAFADLTSTDLSGNLVSLGQGFAQLSDPALDQENPEELALEVGCYSNATSVSYLVQSTATESRTIVFTSLGSSVAPPDIRFGTDRTRTVESSVFLNGAIMFWSKAPAASLANMKSDLRVAVEHDGRSRPLFETTLVLTGSDDGVVGPTATGPIRFEIIDLEELATRGVDEASLAVLQAVADSGTLLVIAIPAQEHVYDYEVRANEDFVLTATLEARVRNAPEGTGVAAVLGRPFANLADFVERGLPGVDGLAIEQTINEATGDRALGLVTDDAAPWPRPALCGALGAEALALLFLTLLPGRLRPRFD